MHELLKQIADHLGQQAFNINLAAYMREVEDGTVDTSEKDYMIDYIDTTELMIVDLIRAIKRDSVLNDLVEEAYKRAFKEYHGHDFDA